MAVEYDRRILVEIDVTDTHTLYLSNDPATVSDGDDAYFYDDRITNISSIEKTIGSVLDPRYALSTIELGIRDGKSFREKDRISYLLRNYFGLANREIRIFIGNGREKGAYSRLFTGQVRVPGGAEVTENDVTLTLETRRVGDNIVISQRVTPDNYPNAPEESIDLPVPRLFGEWADESVPAIDIGKGSFLICQPGDLKSITNVYNNGNRVNNFSVDINKAQVTIPGYSSGTITVNASGATGSIVDLFEFIMSAAGIQPESISAESMADWRGDAQDAFRARIFVDKDSQSLDLLTKIAAEGFRDFIINEEGKVSTESRIPDVEDNLPTIHTHNLVPEDQDSGTRRFMSERDPHQTLTNQVNIFYRHSPGDSSKDRQVYSIQAGDSVTQLGNVYPREITLEYLYNLDDIQRYGFIWLLAFAYESDNVIFSVSGNIGERAKIGKQFKVAHGEYENEDGSGTTFQARNTEYDPDNDITEIEAWSLDLLRQNEWAPDDAPDWEDATTEEQNKYLYWTDDAGLINGDGTTRGKNDWGP